MINLAEIIQNLIHTNLVISELIASAITFSLIAVVGWFVYFIFNRYLIAWTKKTKTNLDDDILRNLNQ
jgi:hypothetical protein